MCAERAASYQLNLNGPYSQRNSFYSMLSQKYNENLRGDCKTTKMYTFELYCGVASYPAYLAAFSEETEFGLNSLNYLKLNKMSLRWCLQKSVV